MALGVAGLHCICKGGGCAGDGTRVEAAERQHSGSRLPAGGVPVEPGQVPGRGRALLQGHCGGKQHLRLAVLPQDPRLWCAKLPFLLEVVLHDIKVLAQLSHTSQSADSSHHWIEEPSGALLVKQLRNGLQ